MNTSLPPISDPIVKRGEVICSTKDIQAGGLAYRFQIICGQITPFPGMNADEDDFLPAFLIQFGQAYHAYLNRCAHVAMELDWNPGEVFDLEREHLVCATHYAVYDPSSGKCLSGPCPKGAHLIALPVTLKDGLIYFAPL
jgi:nitrite reductase/ring-hydroxylating ferredoxin subunit